MKKRPKGKTQQQIRQEQVHQKRLYLQKLQSVMDTIASEPAYHLLGLRETEMFYLTRLRPLKLKSAIYHGRALPDSFMKYVNDYFTGVLKKTDVPLYGGNIRINLYDFFTFVETIYLTWRNTTKDHFPNAAEFIARFPVFNEEYKEKRVEAVEMVHRRIEQLAWMLTHVLELIVWIEPEEKPSTGGRYDASAFFNNYVVHADHPETEILDIDGKKRSIFRLGVGMEKGISWLSVTPEKLGIHGVPEKLPLKAYIQKHAVERIKERLGKIFEDMNFFLVTNAVLECDVYPADGSSLLLSCKYDSIKVGYFKADIIGDKLLIRTFLFVTNNGTPEGKKLGKILGIQKEDKKYLGIDKLSTFINSDIEQNESLKAIFYQAGCGDLFGIKDYIAQDQDHIIRCADYFSKYLGLEKEEGRILAE